MINTDVTIYHKTLDKINKIEVWQRYYYPYTWWYGGVNSSTNRGYDTTKNVNVRLWYNMNDIDIANFSVGDIVVKGKVEDNITTQQDLINKEYCNITGINDNKIGQSPHIHIKGQ